MNRDYAEPRRVDDARSAAASLAALITEVLDISGIAHLPREVTAFEIDVFLQISAEEARIIEERRRPELKLGLAPQNGFLRRSGRLVDAVRIVPPLVW